MTDTSKAYLHLLNERICGKINDGYGPSANDVAEMLDAIKALTAENDHLKARVEELEGVLSIIANHRSECHSYDDDAGHQRRDFDAEDVRLMEYAAKSALKNKDASDD